MYRLITVLRMVFLSVLCEQFLSLYGSVEDLLVVVVGTELFIVMQLWPITFGALRILSACVFSSRR